ncbi:hypothetical protein LOS17_06875 [Klebsiella pneumoniae]|nr:hypothetical protein [Klebsiella pneumoniae]
MAKPKYSPETKLAVVNHYLSGKDGRARRQPPPGEITGTVPDILPGGAALARACEV